MAVTPQNSDVFLREVDEELRREQMATFWRRNGRWVAIGIVVALLLVAGFMGWRYWQGRQAETQSERFDAAMDKVGANDAAGAAPILSQLAGSGNEGYATMARFTQADALLQKDDLAGAAAKLGEIARDGSVAQPLRDLALVRQTSAEFDRVPPQTVVDRMKPLAVPGNPWLGSAGELTAAAYLKMNRRDLAGRMLGQVSRDATVPDSIRQRAVQMAGVLGVDAVATPGSAETGAGAAGTAVSEPAGNTAAGNGAATTNTTAQGNIAR